MRRARDRGVYWGRFNPPHRGHLGVIRRLRRRWALVVAVGSSERRDERSNPFSGAERKRMLEAYLREERIDGVPVVTLRDGRSVAWAVANLIRRCRPDVLLLSTEKSALADRAGRQVRVVRFPRTGRISSTRVRDAIAAGSDAWRKWTGRSVAELIEELDGVRRIQRAYRRTGRGRA